MGTNEETTIDFAGDKNSNFIDILLRCNSQKGNVHFTYTGNEIIYTLLYFLCQNIHIAATEKCYYEVRVFQIRP